MEREKKMSLCLCVERGLGAETIPMNGMMGCVQSDTSCLSDSFCHRPVRK